MPYQALKLLDGTIYRVTKENPPDVLIPGDIICCESIKPIEKYVTEHLPIEWFEVYMHEKPGETKVEVIEVNSSAVAQASKRVFK